MALLEKTLQIADLVCDTAAEFNQPESDILKWVKAEIIRREREVLMNLGKWTDDDEKDWRETGQGKTIPRNLFEVSGS